MFLKLPGDVDAVEIAHETGVVSECLESMDYTYLNSLAGNILKKREMTTIIGMCCLLFLNINGA